MPQIVVTVHRASGVKWKSIFPWRKAPKLYVEVVCGDPKKVQKTQVICDLAPQWNANISLEIKNTDETIHFYLRRCTLLRRDPSMGTISITANNLISQSHSEAQVLLSLGRQKDGKQVVTPLTIFVSAKEGNTAKEDGTAKEGDAAKKAGAAKEDNPAKKNDPAEQSDVGGEGGVAKGPNVPKENDTAKESDVPKKSDIMRNVKVDLELAQEAVNRNIGKSDNMDPVSTVVGNLQSLSKKLSSVTSVIMDKMDDLAELHPYANIAWKICSSLYETVKQKHLNDRSLLSLVETMNKTFSFVNTLDNLPEKIKDLKEVITRVLGQTTECSLFIRKYVDRGSATNIIMESWQSQKPKIDEFMEAFANLQKDLDSGALLHSTLVTFKISEDVSALLESDHMKSLKPSPMNLANSERSLCLPGTRTVILDEITEWALKSEGDQQQNILWLHGVAGSGKSTIATTIAEHFRKIRRRGAYLFFERSKSDPSAIVRTLAYKLAEFDSNICKAVCASIKANRGIADESLATQFETLLKKPLQEAADKLTGPIVIVLDALDECGGQSARALVLELLAEKLPKLPSVFRFLITSRRERDIEGQFSGKPESIRSYELTVGEDLAKSDIQAYIWREMKKTRDLNHLSLDWPPKSQVEKLVEYSEGLFIWVSTMCSLVREAASPVMRLDRLLSSFGGDLIKGLDPLYAAVLKDACTWKHDDMESWEHFRSVMTAVLFSRKRLNNQTIDHLLGLTDENPCCLILTRLQCLLDYTPGEPIRPLHASFRDYLIDEKRSNGKPWSLSSFNPEHYLASCCFTVMLKQLCFNRCMVKSSHESSTPTNYNSNIKGTISLELRYASEHWSGHLLAVHTLDNTLISLLQQFSHKKLLFWLEVLAHLGPVRADSVCAAIAKIIKGYDSDLSTLWEEAEQFIYNARVIISHMTPHIYLSALPFTSPQSQIKKIYGPQFPNTIQVSTEKGTSNDILGTGGISHLGFSPDGKMLISCFGDGSVQIRRTSDYAILPEYNNLHHLDSIQVAKLGYNNNVVYCLIGQGALVAWDVKSTATVTLLPASVSAFEVQILPSGEHIVAVCADEFIYVWSRESSDLEFSHLEKKVANTHLTSIAMANDGKVAVSGPTGEVIILDAKLDPLPGEKSFKNNDQNHPILAFSPDSRFLLVASGKRRVSIWSMGDEDPVILSLSDLIKPVTRYRIRDPKHLLNPLQVIPITWLGYGHTLFIGLNDGSVSLFDMDARQVVAHALCEGERMPDITGKEMTTMKMITLRLIASRKMFIQVAASPDGMTLASGYNNIYIWDPTMLKQSEGNYVANLGMNAENMETHLTQLPSEWLLDRILEPFQDQGRIHDPQDALVLVIPKAHRRGLYWLGCKHSIGPELKTRLDFSRFVHGERWTECYQPDGGDVHPIGDTGR
ncbi:hypothetical protein QCA50_010987 [Cerrena zonata]|uniref:C2 domain-containing protein n=1 Tax=Cerrena zonata TaxID=2478898 RepID=A0AAW0FVS0_9APHY